jgi:flagellar hook-basal body complex protein FliE
MAEVEFRPNFPVYPESGERRVSSDLDFSNPFEDILGKAIESLGDVSAQENYTNDLIEKYVAGEVDLQKVMTEMSKMNLMVQLATTTVNLAVTTFKEILAMQV